MVFLQRIPILLAILTTIGVGCSHAPPTAQPSPGSPFPFSLQGANGLVNLDFNSHPAVTVAYDLAEDEFCYLPVGDALLICAQEGSYLVFGPEDGIVVVKDNPVYQLHPVGNDPAAGEMMHQFGNLFVVAASVDRLPEAVSAYLDNPGYHRRQALALARKLLQDNGAAIGGSGRGGTFAITFRLSADARQMLVESLQSDDNSDGIYRIGNKLSERGDFPLNKRGSLAGGPSGS
ncbi:MAG TPA: hypothetical protein VFE47_21105 [Tepidisphaeraceae bacterium]|jgi:hypothetical protein|nr:hypothetical protein [Tepidisphaeraceae bacterium]